MEVSTFTSLTFYRPPRSFDYDIVDCTPLVDILLTALLHFTPLLLQRGLSNDDSFTSNRIQPVLYALVLRTPNPVDTVAYGIEPLTSCTRLSKLIHYTNG